MEEFEDDFNIDDHLHIDLGWNDYDVDRFLNKPTFRYWYRWAYGSLVGEEPNSKEIYHRIQKGRMFLIDGVNHMVQDLLEEENYELIPKVKEHCEKLLKDGLELAMKVERFI